MPNQNTFVNPASWRAGVLRVEIHRDTLVAARVAKCSSVYALLQKLKLLHSQEIVADMRSNKMRGIIFFLDTKIGKMSRGSYFKQNCREKYREGREGREDI